MIDFTPYTQDYLAMVQLDQVPNWLDKRELSLIALSSSMNAYTLAGFYQQLDQVQRSAFILTAIGDDLAMWGEQVGVAKKGATRAIRLGVFDVPIDIGTRFASVTDGVITRYFASRSLGLQDDGLMHYEMTCEEPGQIGNEYFGPLRALDVVPNNLSIARLEDVLIAGTDAEDDDAYRERILDALLTHAFGGNIASYRNYLLEQETVGAVQIYPIWDGNGTVKASFLDANYDVATPELVAQMQELICPPDEGQDSPSQNGYGVAPIGAIATVTTGTRLDVNISLTLTLGSGVTVAEIRDEVEANIDAYFLNIRRNWGPRVVNRVEYPVVVYQSQISNAIATINGIIDIPEILLNGTDANIVCEESGTLQQVPYRGTVSINGNT